jgi:hypothetical protein
VQVWRNQQFLFTSVLGMSCRSDHGCSTFV